MLPMCMAMTGAAGGLGLTFIGMWPEKGKNGPDLDFTGLDVEAGDLLIIMSKGVSTTTITAAYGTGVTAIGTIESNSGGAAFVRVCLGYKIAAGNEDVTGIVATISATDDGGAIAVYRPTQSISTVTVQGLATAATGGAGDLADQTINANANQKATIAVAAYAEYFSQVTISADVPGDDQQAEDEWAFYTKGDTGAAITISHTNGASNGSAVVACYLEVE